MDMRCPIDREINIRWIGDRITTVMGSNASAHKTNSGLEQEKPELGPANEIYKRMLGDSLILHARDLEAAVTDNVWCAVRATQESQLQLKTRCGLHPETFLHRLWACENNAECSRLDVINAQHRRVRAVSGSRVNGAFWLGCVLTTFMLTPKPNSVLRQDSHLVITGGFAALLRRTGRGGLDGSGGRLSTHSRLRAVGRSVILFGENSDEIIAKATMSS